MRAEYRFDWSKAKPNRFAARLKDTVSVVLEPDVAAVFQSSDAVNEVLRGLIRTMPPVRRSARAKPAPRKRQA